MEKCSVDCEPRIIDCFRITAKSDGQLSKWCTLRSWQASTGCQRLTIQRRWETQRRYLQAVRLRTLRSWKENPPSQSILTQDFNGGCLFDWVGIRTRPRPARRGGETSNVKCPTRSASSGSASHSEPTAHDGSAVGAADARLGRIAIRVQGPMGYRASRSGSGWSEGCRRRR